jgi:hypothetical protein
LAAPQQGSTPPVGVSTPPGGWRRTEMKTIIRDPKEQSIIAEILKRRSVGETYRSIANDLQHRGIKRKRSSRWSDSYVREIMIWYEFYCKRYG